MSQQAALQQIIDNVATSNAAVSDMINDKINSSRSTFSLPGVIKVGSKLPSFRLIDATGAEVTSVDLLAHGALLLTFYRGEWCPYCNISVQHLQRHLAEFQARGVTLVAITPESADFATAMIEKHDLKFPVLTDSHNKFARQLGIVYDQSWAREFHGKLGIDLNARNGDNTWETPVPATILVDKSGTVRNIYVEIDFRKRLEPQTALEWVDKLNQQ